jgi:hypothetical protein
MTALTAEITAVSIPLTLTISQDGVGGISGQSPTVAIRMGATTNSYLDFSDATFKTVGWVLKYGSMTESENGHYTRPLAVASLGLPAGTVLVAEYFVDDGVSVAGVDTDEILLVEQGADTSLVRKAITNRQEEAPGLPGRIILYDDDDLTPIVDQELRDNADGAIIPATGVPAKRTRSTI